MRFGLGCAGRHIIVFPGRMLDCTGTELRNLAFITLWDLVLLELGLVVPFFQQAVCPHSEEIKRQHPCIYVRITQEAFDKSFSMELLLHACRECILQSVHIRTVQLRNRIFINSSPASSKTSPGETLLWLTIITQEQGCAMPAHVNVLRWLVAMLCISMARTMHFPKPVQTSGSLI